MLLVVGFSNLKNGLESNLKTGPKIEVRSWILEIKSMFKCSKCNEKVQIGDTHCKECKTSLVWPKKILVSLEGLRCSNCGIKVSINNSYCTQCNAKLVWDEKKINSRNNFLLGLSIPMFFIGFICVIVGCILVSGGFSTGLERFGYLLFLFGGLVGGGGISIMKSGRR